MVTNRNIFLIRIEPPLMAHLAPRNPPETLPIAIVNPSSHMICEFKPKTRIAPKLVERLTILAVTDACRKAKPITATKISIKKEPVPGPKIPS